MKHRIALPALLLALTLSLAALAGCGAGAPASGGASDPAQAPAVTPDPGSAAPAQDTAPAGQEAWPVPATGIEFAPIENFAPAGVVRAMADSRSGAGSAAGYYDVYGQEDGSALLTFVDYATNQWVVLCSQPNCAHNSEACPAWYSYGNALRVYPIGDKLAVLQGGAPYARDWLGDRGLAKVDVMNADGSGRQTVFTFPASCWVSTLPHYHMARDEENLYFVILETTESGDRQAILCAADIQSGQVFALCGLPEDETHLVGGTDNALVLEYTPGINQSLDTAPADTQVVKLDLATRTLTPLASYPFGTALVTCDSEMLYLLDSTAVQSINLVDGSTAARLPVTLPEGCSSIQRLEGVYDGRLVAVTWTDGSVTQSGTLCSFAIDPTSGARTDLPYCYEDGAGGAQPCLPLAEAGDKLLCQVGTTNIQVTVAGAPEGQGQGSQSRSQYALVPKADFWAGTADMTPLPLS